jgi:hypothetical protein
VGEFLGGFAFTNGVNLVQTFAAATVPSKRIGYGIVCALLFGSVLAWATVIRCAAHLGFQTDTLSYLAEEHGVSKSAYAHEHISADSVKSLVRAHDLHNAKQLADSQPKSGQKNADYRTLDSQTIRTRACTEASQHSITPESRMEDGVPRDVIYTEAILEIERKHEYCNHLMHYLIFNFRYVY